MLPKDLLQFLEKGDQTLEDLKRENPKPKNPTLAEGALLAQGLNMAQAQWFQYQNANYFGNSMDARANQQRRP